MATWKKKIISLLYPVTVLTLVMLVSIVLTLQALFVIFTHDSTAAIYAAVTIPITLLLFLLFLVDRWLIKRVAYYQLVVGEIILGTLIFFLLAYQNKKVDIWLNTNNDYILVLFDSKEKVPLQFKKKGLFGKELSITSEAIFHLDSALYNNKELRIHEPLSWKGFESHRGRLSLNGYSVTYLFYSKNSLPSEYRKHPQAYLDSLLTNE